MQLRPLALAITFGIVCGCVRSPGTGADVGATKNIFGRDDRAAVTSNAYPWSTIGYFSDNGSACTGTLVGPALVLTAAHCVMDASTNKLMDAFGPFYPNLVGGTAQASAGVTHVWWGTTTPSANRGDDWAILQLDTRLGDTFGWMGSTSLEADAYENMPVNVAGYSGDFGSGLTASVDQTCSVRAEVGGLLYHDCDMTRGASGGPIFHMVGNNAYIVGVNAAEFRNGGEDSLQVGNYSDQYANLGVPAAAFVDKIQELRQ